MITQVNPPIPIITPKGKGICHFVIDYGPESHIIWHAFIDSTGEPWWFENDEIKAQKNITLKRKNISPFYDPHDVAFKKSDND